MALEHDYGASEVRLGPSVLGGSSLALGLILGFVVPRPVIDNSAESFLRGADDEAFATYERFLHDFGSDELVIIEFTGAADHALGMARRLETRMKEETGVLAVVGFPTLFEAATDILLDRELGGFDSLANVRPRLAGPVNRALGLFDPDSGRTLTLVTLERASPDARRRIEESLESIRAEATQLGLQARMAGNPLVNLALDRAARELEVTFLPLLIFTCMLLLVLFTGSLRIAFATLMTVGLAIFTSEGLLSLAGLSTNLIVGISKPLVFVILLASSLHLLVAYQEARHQGLKAKEAAWRAGRFKARATALALITTAVGFGVMMSAPIAAMQTFGVITAVTLLFGLLLVLFGLPLLLGLFGGPPSTGLGNFIGPWTAQVVAWSAKRPAIPAFAALVSVAGGLTLFDLRPDPHAIRYLAPSHALRLDHEALERSGRPLSNLELVMSSTSTTLTRSTLEALNRLRLELDDVEDVKAVLDANLLLREAQHRASGLDALPDDLFTDEALRTEIERFRPFWNPERGRVRVSLLIPTLDSGGVLSLSEKVRRAFARTMEPLGFSLEITGNHALIVSAQDALLSTLLRSLLLTTAVLQLVLFIGLGSFRLGLIALLPNLLPVTANFGLMMLFSTPLDVGTSMTAAIALGIAVDDTLHFILDHRSSMDLDKTARSTGRALVSSSVIIGVGFLMLMPSDFSPTRNFGFLCASAMLIALAGNLLVLPRLISSWGPRGAPSQRSPAS